MLGAGPADTVVATARATPVGG
eukprot:SAG31_NODE_23825_length_494_cov_3.632911_1_plen_21_part_01